MSSRFDADATFETAACEFIQLPPAEHHRHLTEPGLGAFWRSIKRQKAHFVTTAAAKMLMFGMCVKSAVLRSRWSEFDLDEATWDVPAARMK